MPVMHGWYSEESAAIGGSLIYAKADGTGEVEVTYVSADINIVPSWKDAVYRGTLGRFLRDGKTDKLAHYRTYL